MTETFDEVFNKFLNPTLFYLYTGHPHAAGGNFSFSLVCLADRLHDERE